MSLASGEEARRVPLLEVAELLRGVSYKREEARKQASVGLLPVLRANNIQDGRLVFDDLVYVPSHRVSQAQRLRRGDVVIAMSSGSRDIVGKAALVTSDWEGGFGAFCGVLRARGGAHPEFLFHYLQSPMWRGAIERIVTGTNINNLSRTTLDSIEVPLIPSDAQAQLARLLTAVDESRRRCLRHIAATKRALSRFRKALLAAAFSGRLTLDWRYGQTLEPGEELVRRLVESSSSASRARPGWPPTAGGDAPEVPESWGVAPFSDLTTNYDGSRVPVKASDRSQRRGPYPYYGASGIIDHVEDYLFDGDFLLVSEDGANLLARATPIAFRAHGRFWVNNHAHVVQSRTGILDSYLEIAIEASDLAKYVTGSAQPKLTQAALNGLMIQVPSTAEQEEISRRVQSLLDLAHGAERRLETVEKAVDRGAASILERAFFGGLMMPALASDVV